MCVIVSVCIELVGDLRSIFSISVHCSVWSQLDNLITAQTHCSDTRMLSPFGVNDEIPKECPCIHTHTNAHD